MGDSNEDKLYKAEYAKSGRASCKKCKENIAKDSLRMAIMVQVMPSGSGLFFSSSSPLLSQLRTKPFMRWLKNDGWLHSIKDIHYLRMVFIPAFHFKGLCLFYGRPLLAIKQLTAFECDHKRIIKRVINPSLA